MLTLFPEAKTPYIIWMPPWDDKSSGVRALHLLCHALNESGQRAYLLPVNMVTYTNPVLNTPLLNEEHLAFYVSKGIEPVYIYPDVVKGNPFQASRVVRWLLAPAGAYGGDASFPGTDRIYGYTRDLGEKVLCLPTFDERIFCPPHAAAREGDCYYAHKYDRIHGNKLLPLTENMQRCEGRPEHVAEILRTHTRCYIYERSEILVNAKLCGCGIIPVVTSYWDGSLPKEFFKPDGSLIPQWELLDSFERQLANFTRETQEWN